MNAQGGVSVVRWQLVMLLVLLLGGGALLTWSALGTSANPVRAGASAPPLPELPFPLAAESVSWPSHVDRVVLVAAGTPLPAEEAPLYAFARSGMPILRRPASMPSGPIASAPTRITIELPAPSLAAATPEVRAALLVLLGKCGVRGPRAAAAIEVRGLSDEREDLARLLRWMP